MFVCVCVCVCVCAQTKAPLGQFGFAHTVFPDNKIFSYLRWMINSILGHPTNPIKGPRIQSNHRCDAMLDHKKIIFTVPIKAQHKIPSGTTLWSEDPIKASVSARSFCVCRLKLLSSGLARAQDDGRFSFRRVLGLRVFSHLPLAGKCILPTWSFWRTVLAQLMCFTDP